MKVLRLLITDWHANRRNWRGRLITTLYRLASAVHGSHGLIRVLGLPYIAIYKFLTECVLGTELHWKSSIGPGLRIYHGYGLVVHSNAIIGANVILRHGTTIGEARTGESLVPVVGDDVDIGCCALLLGPISIGNGARIGAGSVVVKSVLPGQTVVGNPAEPIFSRS